MATKSYGSVWNRRLHGRLQNPLLLCSHDQDGLPDAAKAVLYSQAQLQGVMCGSYQLFQQYLEAHETAERNTKGKVAGFNVLQPLVLEEQVFRFKDAKKAFELQGSGKFVGKVIIDVA